jgi:hypothetical protein
VPGESRTPDASSGHEHDLELPAARVARVFEPQARIE